MELYLYRTRTRQLTTDGVLTSVDGKRICDTAEYTPTRLPRGTYKVFFVMHPRYGYRCPCLSYIGSHILPVNSVYAKDFGASIAVGEHLVPGVVTHTHEYFVRLVKRLEKAFKRNEDIELIII